MHTPPPSPPLPAPGAPDATHLEELTRRYARFSLSAAGLGSVLGGILALATWLVGGLAPPEEGWHRLVLASAPLVWIGAKEALRHFHYQGLGRVDQVWSRTDRRWHVGLTIFTTLVCAGVIVTLVARAPGGATGLLDPPWLGYLAFVAAMPVLVYRFMRTPLEYVAGVFLVAQAAAVLAGGHYELWQQPQVPLVAVALVVLGAREHREFRAVRRELLAGAAAPGPDRAAER